MYLAFAASSMSWYLYTCLYTLMIHRHEHIYSIDLSILSMLSSGTCFQLSIPFMAPMLLYFYMIHIAFVSWPGSGAFQYMRSIYLFTLWESVALVLNAHEINQGIYFLYTFLALYMIHCTNYIPAFI